jgi:transcriptional/translational regulatory protein YebC/TACO1
MHLLTSVCFQIFEFYGHGGVGIMVHVLTDNDNRASADVG